MEPRYASAMTPTLKLLSSMAPREIITAAVAQYEPCNDTRIDAHAAGGAEVARRVADGEVVDIVVLAAEAIDHLIYLKKLLMHGRTDLMTSEIAVAVRAGVPHPPMHDEAACRNSVLTAASVGYSTGPSGRYLEALFDRWDILAAIRSRLLLAPPGVPVARLIVAGEVSLGFQQLSELQNVANVEIIAMLPPAIRHVTTFTAAVSSTSRAPSAAHKLVSFLASASLDPIKQRYGMTPSRSSIDLR